MCTARCASAKSTGQSSPRELAPSTTASPFRPWTCQWRPPWGIKPSTTATPWSTQNSGFVIPSTGKLWENRPEWFNYQAVIEPLKESLMTILFPKGKGIASLWQCALPQESKWAHHGQDRLGISRGKGRRMISIVPHPGLHKSGTFTQQSHSLTLGHSSL